jgi:hypothetical protein
MSKYNIEGNIDFYTELYSSLDIDDTLDSNDSNICLITNQPLTDYYVTMKCGHKFNYIPIYKDIVNHKQKFNTMEGVHGKLEKNQIRCPYCRKKQDSLLPYYEDLQLPKIYGVNSYDNTITNTIIHKNTSCPCSYKYHNEHFNPNLPESDTNMKYLDKKCNHYINNTKIQIYNPLDPSNPINFGDDSFYCYKHKKDMITKYKLEQKLKQKLAAQLAKQKAKEEIKLAKQKAKEEIKISKQLEKQKLKEEKVNSSQLNNVNEIIGESIITTDASFNENITINGCIAIIKYGQNKGKHCGCKIKINNMCIRHSKIVENI